MVYPMLHFRGLLLRYICHTLAFGQFAAHQLVCDLICTALMGALRVAIERCHAQRIYSGLIGKLCAVVVRYRVEDMFPIAANLPFQPLQSADGIGGGLALWLYNDFSAGFTVGHDKAAFARSFGLADDAIQFPMADFFAVPYGLRAVLYAAVFRVRHVGMCDGSFTLLRVSLRQVLIAQRREQLHIDIAVTGGFTYHNTVVIADLRYCILRAGAGQHMRFERSQIVRTVADF